MEKSEKMEKNERFILVEIYKDNNIKTMIGSFNSICKEVEHQLNKIEENKNHYSNIVSATIYDRKDSGENMLDCYYEVSNRILYSQFIDSYFGDESL